MWYFGRREISELRDEIGRLVAGLKAQETEISNNIAKLSARLDCAEAAAKHRHADDLLTRHGLMFGSVVNEYQIEDYDGTTNLVRKLQDLRVVGDCAIHAIPHFVSTSKPTAKIVSEPSLVNGNQFNIRYLGEQDLTKRRRFEVRFPGSLTAATESISYSYSVKIEHAFFMNCEDLEQWARSTASENFNRTKGENVGFDVNYPVESVSFRVIFPKGYLQALNVEKDSVRVVSYFIRESWQSHQVETDRIKPLLKISNNCITCEVPRPVLGFRYAIHWMPPSRKVLKNLASMGD